MVESRAGLRGYEQYVGGVLLLMGLSQRGLSFFLKMFGCCRNPLHFGASFRMFLRT